MSNDLVPGSNTYIEIGWIYEMPEPNPHIHKHAHDYDEIISNAWDKLKSDVTGVTCDLGALYQFKFGTSVGVTLQNIIPVKEIRKSIDTE